MPVLRGAYKLPRDAVINAFEGLLALEWHRQGMVFADAFYLARSEGCGALISFDRQLAMVAGQLNLQPAIKSP